MKRISIKFALIALIAVFLLQTGFYSKAFSVSSTVKKSSSNFKYGASDNASKAGSILDRIQDSDKVKYKIIDRSYVKGEISIKYPEISEMKSSKQNRINDLIKGEAMKALDSFKDTEKDLYMDLNYTVCLKKPTIMSIQFAGMANVKQAAHPDNIFFTLNIDMTKGTKMTLSDFVKNGSALTDDIRKGRFKPLVPGVGPELDSLTKQQLNDYIQNADVKGSDVYSYLKEGALGISIPVSHAAGDHTELETAYESISSNIK